MAAEPKGYKGSNYRDTAQPKHWLNAWKQQKCQKYLSSVLRWVSSAASDKVDHEPQPE